MNLIIVVCMHMKVVQPKMGIVPLRIDSLVGATNCLWLLNWEYGLMNAYSINAVMLADLVLCGSYEDSSSW